MSDLISPSTQEEITNILKNDFNDQTDLPNEKYVQNTQEKILTKLKRANNDKSVTYDVQILIMCTLHDNVVSGSQYPSDSQHISINISFSNKFYLVVASITAIPGV